MRWEWHREVPWAEVAAGNRRVVHPAMEWASITGHFSYRYNDQQSPLWDEAPAHGSLPYRQAVRLAADLANFTATPERCWFAIWEGFGDLPAGIGNPPKLPMPHRDMILLAGPLTAVPDTSFGYQWYETVAEHRPEAYRSPSLWWPDDRTWCVATDVDLDTSYLGGSQACVDALVGDDELEVLEVTANQLVTVDADTINPQPGGDYYTS